MLLHLCQTDINNTENVPFVSKKVNGFKVWKNNQFFLLSDEHKNLWLIYCVCLNLNIFKYKHIFFCSEFSLFFKKFTLKFTAGNLIFQGFELLVKGFPQSLTHFWSLGSNITFSLKPFPTFLDKVIYSCYFFFFVFQYCYYTPLLSTYYIL